MSSAQPDLHLGAAEVCGVTGPEDFPFGQPELLHLLAADAQEGDKACGQRALDTHAQAGLEVRAQTIALRQATRNGAVCQPEGVAYLV